MKLRVPAPWIVVLTLLFVAELAFWKFQIFDLRSEASWAFGNADLFTEHHPMALYGFSVLRSGALPLWNPYQLCGLPFLAIPHTGILYPGNLVYLLMDTAWATEASLVLHVAFGGFGMWLLARALAFPRLAALGSALTFMWSGWMVVNLQWPNILAGMCWLPASVLCVDRLLRGSRAAPFALALAVALQVLNGATEYLVYNLYTAALYAGFGLVASIRSAGWRVAAVRAALLAGGVGAGVLLSAPQLLPSLELVSQAARSFEPLGLEQVRQQLIAPGVLLEQILSVRGYGAVGLLPLLGLVLGAGSRRFASVWGFAVTAGLLAVLLAIGSPLHELYYQTPLGGMFRRPTKFLHVLAFAQALLCAVALARLSRWSSAEAGGRGLWRQPRWLAGPLALTAALVWLGLEGGSPVQLAAVLALLLAFGATRGRRLRRAILLTLLLLHGAGLFVSGERRVVRPVSAPGAFDRQARLLADMKRLAGHERVYLPVDLFFDPALTTKQGVIRRLRVPTDYEPLVLSRQRSFFAAIAGPESPGRAFAGQLPLVPSLRWPLLLDLTSTRLVLLRRGAEIEPTLFADSAAPVRTGIRRLTRRELDHNPFFLRIYERTRSLPRAYFVAETLVVASPQAALEALTADGFDPNREVVLEADSLEPPPTGPRSSGSAAFVRDEPERVELDVNSRGPGLVVLTDTFYPGWKAYLDGRETPIRRANYLFRAVATPGGRHRIRFEYEPASFRIGLWLAAATAAAMAAAAWASRPRRDRSAERASPA